MKKLVFLFASLFITVIAVQNVTAQNTAEITEAVANATIITPITLTNDLTLELGKLVKPGSGTGVVTIAANSSPNRTLGSGLTAIPNDIWRAAKFTVTADDNQNFSIAKDATITLAGTGTAAGDELTVNTTISGSTSEVTTDNGSYVFYIGGTMNVLSTIKSGAYTGTYNVSVAYE
jgi:hypothetical protein